MIDFARFRRFAGLRQVDVSFATGVSLSRLSAIERVAVAPSPSEERVLRDFLAGKITALNSESCGMSSAVANAEAMHAGA